MSYPLCLPDVYVSPQTQPTPKLIDRVCFLYFNEICHFSTFLHKFPLEYLRVTAAAIYIQEDPVKKIILFTFITHIEHDGIVYNIKVAIKGHDESVGTFLKSLQNVKAFLQYSF